MRNRPQTANTNANVQFSLPLWFHIDWTLASLVKVVWPYNALNMYSIHGLLYMDLGLKFTGYCLLLLVVLTINLRKMYNHNLNVYVCTINKFILL